MTKTIRFLRDFRATRQWSGLAASQKRSAPIEWDSVSVEQIETRFKAGQVVRVEVLKLKDGNMLATAGGALLDDALPNDDFEWVEE